MSHCTIKMVAMLKGTQKVMRRIFIRIFFYWSVEVFVVLFDLHIFQYYKLLATDRDIYLSYVYICTFMYIVLFKGTCESEQK